MTASAKSESSRRSRIPSADIGSRIRITSDGKIPHLPVFGLGSRSARQMRRGASDEELSEFIRGVIQKKEERHHIGEPDFVPASRTMVHIGG